MKKNITYKTSGVDIDKANSFVSSIKKSVFSTHNKSVLVRTGAFGSLFSLDLKKIKNPVLVSSTDGVGTKLLLANKFKKHDTVGIDLVAMNVNDILCVGAKPLFFLDYIACGKLDPKVLKDVVSGIAKGCNLSGCSLIGGETAEMPGMYKVDDYDLAGFAVGVVDKDKIIDGSRIKEGDQIIGLPSSGIHSNGYSLVRKALGEKLLLKHSKEIIKPTRIYVQDILPLVEKYQINGIAHNTGGAFYEKLTKIVPNGKCLNIKLGSWKVPALFALIQEQGNIENVEMYKTFNMGIGMILVVPKSEKNKVCNDLTSRKIVYFDIGEVTNGSKKIKLF